MKRALILLALLALIFARPALSQTGMVTVTAANLTDSTGAPISNASACFQPTNNSGTPNGALVGTWQVADPTAAGTNLVSDPVITPSLGTTWTSSTGWSIGVGNGEYVGLNSLNAASSLSGLSSSTLSVAAIAVVPGQAYTFSAYIDATYVTGGVPQAQVMNTGGSLAYATVTAVDGTAARYITQFTVPAGATSVVVAFEVDGAIITSGQSLYFGAPLLQAGTSLLADTNLSSPENVCYNLTVTDNGGNVLLSYPCLQPAYSNAWCTAGVCNLDSYIPTGTPGALMEAGGPAGAMGPTGPTGPGGADPNAVHTTTTSTQTLSGQLALPNYGMAGTADVDVRSLGALGNTTYAGGGTILSGSLSTLTMASATFVSGDTRTVVVAGAGPAIGGVTYALVSPITYVSPTVAILTTAASQAVSAASVWAGHDDTTAIQAAIVSANTLSRSLYLPSTGGCYLITKSLNATAMAGLWIKGDGRADPGAIGRSPICHALTEEYPVIDISGDYLSGLWGINAGPVGGTGYATNSQATSVVYDKSISGDESRNTIAYSYLVGGTTSTDATVVDYGADEMSILFSDLIAPVGAGYVSGNNQGTASSPASKFQGGSYPNVTYSTVYGSTISSGGGSAAPLQFTASAGGAYLSGGNYINTAGGTQTHIIEGIGLASGLHISETRTETTLTSPEFAVWFSSQGGLYVDGANALSTSQNAGSYTFGGPGGLISSVIHYVDNCLGSTIGGFFDFPGTTGFQNDEINVNVGGCGRGHFGTAGNSYGTTIYYAGPDTAAAILADVSPSTGWGSGPRSTQIFVGYIPAFSADLNHGVIPVTTSPLTSAGSGNWQSPVTAAVSGAVQTVSAVATTLTCSVTPAELVLRDCGSSGTSCGQIVAYVNLTTQGAVTQGSLYTPLFNVGDHLQWEMEAGTCTALQVSGNAVF